MYEATIFNDTFCRKLLKQTPQKSLNSLLGTVHKLEFTHIQTYTMQTQQLSNSLQPSESVIPPTHNNECLACFNVIRTACVKYTDIITIIAAKSLTIIASHFNQYVVITFLLCSCLTDSLKLVVTLSYWA